MANKKISDYTESLSVADDDFFEISVDLGGGSYTTRKVKKSNLGIGGSPLTTKGDLYTFDSADARLGVGSDGQVLIADSTTATGLKWDTASGGNTIYTADDSLTGNRVLNLATYSLEVQNSTASTILKLDDAGGFALGSGATYADSSNVSIGLNASASVVNAVSIGISSSASVGNSVALGASANVTGSGGVAIGRNSDALNAQTIALGEGATATGNNNISMGAFSSSNSVYGMAIGRYANCTGGIATAIGSEANVTGLRSLSIGNKAIVSGNYSILLSASPNSVTNSTSNSFEVNLNNTTSVFRFGNTVDGWLNSTGGFVFGATTVNASAALQVDSTTKGFLPPRMTTTEKNAITTPATGLVVFDTTLAKLCVYTGAAWETVTSS